MTLFPLLILSDDVMWMPRLEAAARQNDMQAVFTGTPASLWEALEHTRTCGVALPPQVFTHLKGKTAPAWPLVELLTRWQPRLLLIDLANRAFAWQDLLPMLTSLAETRHIPVACYGPHVQPDALRRARRLGAVAAWPRSRLAAAAPRLLQRYARPLPLADSLACQPPLPASARQGVLLFNRGEYYAAHEVLEEAWRADSTPGRDLYQGMLQVGVACLQIERGNWRGALKMFRRARRCLLPLPEICRGVDVAHLRHSAEQACAALLAQPPDGMERIPRGIQPIILHE